MGRFVGKWLERPALAGFSETEHRMQAKPVQIAIIVIGLIVGVTGIVLALRGNSVNLAGRMVFVDVASGDLFAVSTKGRSVLIPYQHPETKLPTLLPAIKNDDDNAWYLKGRYMGALKDMESITDLLDRKSGRLSIDAKSKPKAID